MKNSLFIFGLGYSASVLAKNLAAKNWHISGTSRDYNKCRDYQCLGYEMFDFADTNIQKALIKSTHLLVSIPPSTEQIDPTLELYGNYLRSNLNGSSLQWIGYLSSTGVYGDHQGAWVDEDTLLKPSSNKRAEQRTAAEIAWLTLGQGLNIQTNIFRLSGIYGPQRNVIQQLKHGQAQCIFKEGQVFSRIHVDDIANTLEISMHKSMAGAIYNISDDEPAPSHEVMQYAASLLGLPPPTIIPYHQAALSEMAQEFYSNNRRIKNDRIKNYLGIKLQYPTYREGLATLIYCE
ncbi:SDR family oxidoreductase [Candidatus Trichorickettsia mobilis]|uniref:SDR family oxidoreductase n=1 Tax=Candidatus Trichorickettsia mobilis TaxID=1346319 RepID=A0ABZ0UVC6_9RICK|nr:SDR family oxidoreductase [Candidatus Trichorickettsia mobilis]WPY00923.1 SDR family oxidoreductase [Candidatus Trichorickettsia mobilis]